MNYYRITDSRNTKFLTRKHYCDTVADREAEFINNSGCDRGENLLGKPKDRIIENVTYEALKLIKNKAHETDNSSRQEVISMKDGNYEIKLEPDIKKGLWFKFKQYLMENFIYVKGTYGEITPSTNDIIAKNIEEIEEIQDSLRAN